MPSSSYLADGQDKEGGDYGIGASSQQMLAVATAIYIFGEVRGGVDDVAYLQSKV
jgi:hypothetical protein